jgi:hypothetical protein
MSLNRGIDRDIVDEKFGAFLARERQRMRRQTPDNPAIDERGHRPEVRAREETVQVRPTQRTLRLGEYARQDREHLPRQLSIRCRQPTNNYVHS